MAGRGRFIVFEGGEASGKSTQAHLLAEHLGAEFTREPGGTPIGERIRGWLLDRAGAPIDPRTELMFLLAARAEHVAKRIRPALEEGRDVVCDRFSGSTIAYQAYGRGLDPAAVACADELCRGGLEPDLVVLLQLSASKASARRAGAVPDRFEGEDAAFFSRVAKGFAALSRADPGHWVSVDGAGTPAQVHARVRKAVEGRLAGEGGQ